MHTDIPMFDEVVAAFKVRFTNAVAEMRAADDSAGFARAERAVHGLAQDLATEMMRRLLQDLPDDEERRRSALDRVRRRAGAKGIDLRVERKRETEIRTLGGGMIEVVTPYASAPPRRAGARRPGGRRARASTRCSTSSASWDGARGRCVGS